MPKRSYNFQKISKVCSGCNIDFIGHSNTRYCSQKCRDTKSEWAKTKKNNRTSNLEFFLKEKLIRARIRDKYNVTVSYEQLLELYNKQGGLCALSKVPMTHLKGSGNIPTNISLDRIDNNKDYSVDNVQLVCVQANIMKHALTVEQLMFWCRSILHG